MRPDEHENSAMPPNLAVAGQVVEVAGTIAVAGAGYLPAAHAMMLDYWSRTAPETRAAVLLHLAWSGASVPLDQAADLDQVHPAWATNAVELHRLAAAEAQAGTDEADWFGPAFPLGPYPGEHGALVSGLAFGADDAPASLGAALLLACAFNQAQEAAGGGRPTGAENG